MERDARGGVEEIRILEVKSSERGGATDLPKMQPTVNKGLQMSSEWIGKTMNQMFESDDAGLKATAVLIAQNLGKTGTLLGIYRVGQTGFVSSGQGTHASGEDILPRFDASEAASYLGEALRIAAGL